MGYFTDIQKNNFPFDSCSAVCVISSLPIIYSPSPLGNMIFSWLRNAALYFEISLLSIIPCMFMKPFSAGDTSIISMRQL